MSKVLKWNRIVDWQGRIVTDQRTDVRIVAPDLEDTDWTWHARGLQPGDVVYRWTQQVYSEPCPDDTHRWAGFTVVPWFDGPAASARCQVCKMSLVKPVDERRVIDCFPGETRRERYHAYLLSPLWQARRTAKLEEAGHRCRVCNRRERLQVHHRTYARVGFERSDDLTVLCKRCHGAYHGTMQSPLGVPS